MNQPNPTPRGVRLNTTGGVRQRAGGATVQKRAAEQDAEPYATKNSCTGHQIDYYTAVGDRTRCPLCVMERDFDETKAQLLVAQNHLENAQNKLKKIEPQVSLQSAIRQAIEILEDDDYLWLKTQMYQYKIDKSVSLKATHGKLAGGRRVRRGEKLPANGFMSLPRHGDPEGYLATSLGGLAMAEYLDEAISCYGSAQAMGIMLKAWWTVLPGGTE